LAPGRAAGGIFNLAASGGQGMIPRFANAPTLVPRVVTFADGLRP